MSALQELAASTTKIFNVACVVYFTQPVQVRDHAVATHLFRIAQEAVSNAIKHGHATHITIQLKQRHNRASVIVIDNGSGFPKKKPKSKGMGLRIMQSRAGMIGGNLTIENNRSKGACVICSIALKTPLRQKENLRGSTKEKSKR